jgi:hypothetical protein
VPVFFFCLINILSQPWGIFIFSFERVMPKKADSLNTISDLSSIIIVDLNETKTSPIKTIAIEDTRSFRILSLLPGKRFRIKRPNAIIIRANPIRTKGFGKRLYE